MGYIGFLKELIEQMLPNKLSKLGYIFIFLVFIFIPWTLNGGIFNEDVSLVSEESVPYFQTNTCDYSVNSIVRDNFFNCTDGLFKKKLKVGFNETRNIFNTNNLYYE